MRKYKVQDLSDRQLTLLTDRIKKLVSSSSLELPAEYFYSSLAFCLADSIFSMGVRYQSVQNVVANLSSAIKVPCFRNSEYAPYTLVQFSDYLARFSDDKLADCVFQNRQRTSPTSGILKAGAVRVACDVLLKHGISDFEQVSEDSLNDVQPDFLKIKGQGSGISFKYFCMLAGNENLVKPDRMICRFIETALSLPNTPLPEQAESYFFDAYNRLKLDNPKLTPRILDYILWDYQRGADST